MKNKSYISLVLWIAALIGIGSIIGLLTNPKIDTWYAALNRSPWSPPNWIFGPVWTILYALMGTCGWLIWRSRPFSRLWLVKSLYATQLVLNWTWMPLFFHHHLLGLSLISLGAMDILVGALIGLTYSKMRWVSLLMMPYFFWILFATQLNVYIWWNN